MGPLLRSFRIWPARCHVKELSSMPLQQPTNDVSPGITHLRGTLRLDHPPADLRQECHKLKTRSWECSKFRTSLACRLRSFIGITEGNKLGTSMMPDYHACLDLQSSRRWHQSLTWRKDLLKFYMINRAIIWMLTQHLTHSVRGSVDTGKLRAD